MFNNKKICCLSDLHIGVHQNTSIWHNISIDFANWLVKQLDENGIKDIVICGDINNDRNEISVNSLNVVSKIFKIWKKYNIKIIVGNHDAYYKDRSDINSLALLAGWDNIEIVDEIKSINQFDNDITFCPWAVELDQIPKSDILFGHFDIAGFKMTKGKICAEGLRSEHILNKANLVVTGHFHMREERKYKDGTIIYLGCPYQLNWGDYGETKGVYLLDLETKEYEFIENKLSPKHKKITLSELKANKKITSDLKEEFKGNFINFIVDEEINPDKLDKLVTKLGTLNAISIKTEFNLEDKYNIDENYEFTGIDISDAISEFVNILEIQNKKEVLSYMLDLYKRVS